MSAKTSPVSWGTPCFPFILTHLTKAVNRSGTIGAIAGSLMPRSSGLASHQHSITHPALPSKFRPASCQLFLLSLKRLLMAKYLFNRRLVVFFYSGLLHTKLCRLVVLASSLRARRSLAGLALPSAKSPLGTYPLWLRSCRGPEGVHFPFRSSRFSGVGFPYPVAGPVSWLG